jgi:hypothetical protein
MQRVITDEKIEAKEHEHSGIQNSASFANWSSVDKSNSSISKWGVLLLVSKVLILLSLRQAASFLFQKASEADE